MNYVTLTNLIPSPSFEGSGWNGSYSEEKVLFGKKSLKVTANSSSAETLVQTTAQVPLVNGHTYYARVYGWQDTKTGGGATVGFYWPIAEPSLNDNIPLGNAGLWNLYSAVNVRNFSTSSYPFRIDFNNKNRAGTIWYDGCLLLDLTASFGAGNEPNKEWCDNNIPWFPETMQLSVQDMEVLEISSASISPNPVSARQNFKLSVFITETDELFTTPYRYAGELYAKEGD